MEPPPDRRAPVEPPTPSPVLRTLRRLGELPGRPRALLAVQVAVAFALLAGLVVFVDWRSVARQIAGIEPWALLGAFGSLVLILLLGAFDLWILLGGLARISYLTTLRVYAIGWSSFLALPGSAGDAVQILLLKGEDVAYRQGTAVYLADKLVTLGVNLTVVAAGGWVYLRGQIRSGLLAGLLLLAVATAVAALRVLRRLENPLARRTADLLAAAAGYARRHPARIAANVGGTILKALLAAAGAWLLFQGLGEEVAPGAVLVVHHAAGLVAYLPIAFNGVGTVELAAVALYGGLGVASRHTVAMYLVLRTLILVTAVGALAWATLARRRQPRSGGGR